MSAIGYALNELKYKIPKNILEKAFIIRSTDYRINNNFNIDENITFSVIRSRVLIDCNLVGGTQILISLEGLSFDKPDDFTTVIHIPKSRTQGRSINSVLNVSFFNQSLISLYAFNGAAGNNAYYNTSENSAMMQNAVSAMAAMDKIPVTSTARAQLISENTIMVKNMVNIPGNGYLRCVLANDDDLNHIQPRSYPAFSKLVEYAVKSYIYNTLVIDMDQAELQGGQALGVFKTIVEGYSDSEQNYQDYLRDVWQSVAVCNDDISMTRFLKLTLGGNR